MGCHLRAWSTVTRAQPPAAAEGRQQRGTVLNERDVHPGGVDLGELSGQGGTAQVGEAAGQFHSGGAAADHGHRHVLAQAGEADPV